MRRPRRAVNKTCVYFTRLLKKRVWIETLGER